MSRLTTENGKLVNEADVLRALDRSVNLGPGGVVLASDATKFPINKFGEGLADTTFKTIYSNMAAADFPYKIDVNETMEIVSTDNVDDIGQKVRIFYVEHVAGDWIYKEGIAVSNGTTPVQVQEVDSDDDVVGVANIMIPYRMRNEGLNVTPVSLQGGAVGVITLRTLGGAGDDYIKIQNGNNTSTVAVFPIATGFTGVIYGVGRYSNDTGKLTTFHYNAIPYGQPRTVARVVDLKTAADFEIFPVPYKFPEKTILEVQAKVDVGTAKVGAYWDMTVILTSLLTD